MSNLTAFGSSNKKKETYFLSIAQGYFDILLTFYKLSSTSSSSQYNLAPIYGVTFSEQRVNYLEIKMKLDLSVLKSNGKNTDFWKCHFILTLEYSGCRLGETQMSGGSYKKHDITEQLQFTISLKVYIIKTIVQNFPLVKRDQIQFCNKTCHVLKHTFCRACKKM